MNAPTADTPQTGSSLEISVQSAIKHIGNVASADLSSPQQCHQRRALDVRRNANSSTSLVTRRSVAGLAILIHA